MKIAVIGAGFAGLTAASHLAKAGHDVVVIEKNSTPGGRASVWQKDGFRFDMGPSWYWMPDIIEEFFNDFGEKIEDYYKLIRLDPSYRVFFNKDNVIDVPADYNGTKAMFESLEKGSSLKLDIFLDRGKEFYQVGMYDYTRRPSISPLEFFDSRFLLKTITTGMLRSLGKYIDSQFKSESTRSILKFPVLFLGSHAEKLPLVYSFMNYSDMKLGSWYPMGGMTQLAQAMEKIGKKHGAIFRYDETVTEIKTKDAKVVSLITDKDIIQVDGVVAAGDYHHIEQNLLPPQFRRYDEKYWNSRVMSPSSILFFLGLNRKIPGLAHHNLFFDEVFSDHADAIYKKPSFIDKPLMYVNVPSVTDPGSAPEGYENVFVLIPSPSGLDENQDVINIYKQFLISKIEKYTGINITPHIIVESSYAKTDFEKDYFSFKGNAYGLANTLLQTGPLKPKIKPKGLTNLVFAGQLTVPGPGVPPTIISGKIASQYLINSHDLQ